ncbi:MAG: hypothetical protein H7Y89_06380 [Steroidobacteraceae bacterium]|nr:hypothetical protein [Steroidobacteraceae bacterium]
MEGLLGARKELIASMGVRNMVSRFLQPLRRIAPAAVLLVLAGPAMACLNTATSGLLQAFHKNDKAAVDLAIVNLKIEHERKPSLETANDLAAGWTIVGKYDDAIALLRETETKFPGVSAMVAANLGTALELKGGADADALDWIREGIKRDATEHEGSEWLHVRILEAKIRLASDPQWLEKNSVLGLDFGPEEVPVPPAILPIDNDGKLKGVDELIGHIEYQMLERTKFAKAPDPIVGDLYASAGDLVYAGSDGSPVAFYESAVNYGAPRSALVQKRIARFKKDYPTVDVDESPEAQATEVAAARAAAMAEVKQRRETRKMLWWISGGVSIVALILGGGWLFDRLRPKPERPPLPDIDYDSIGKF